MHHEVRKSCIWLFPIYIRTILCPLAGFSTHTFDIPPSSPFITHLLLIPQFSFHFPKAYLCQVPSPCSQLLIVFRLLEDTKPVFLKRYTLLSEVLFRHIKIQYIILRQQAPKEDTKEICTWIYIMPAVPIDCLLLMFIVHKECEIAGN